MNYQPSNATIKNRGHDIMVNENKLPNSTTLLNLLNTSYISKSPGI